MMSLKRIRHGHRGCAQFFKKQGRHKSGAYLRSMAVFLCFVIFMSLLIPGMGIASAETGEGLDVSLILTDDEKIDSANTSVTMIPEMETATEDFDPTRDGEGFSAVLYDNSNGLPTSEANAVAETADGFLWFGCYSGLVRYDGNTFVRMDSTSGIASVVCLYVDSKQRLWVGTNDSGLAVIEKGETRFFRMKNGLTSDSIREITEAPDGSIYVAMTKGVARINSDMDIQIIDHYVIEGQYIRGICTGADGVIYGLTQNGKVFSIVDRGKSSEYHGANKMEINYQYASRIGIDSLASILPDPADPEYIYLGTEGSKVYRVKINGGRGDIEEYNVAPLTHINCMRKYGDALWICADSGGVGVLENGHLRRLYGIPMDNSIDNVHRDYAGNYWFTSSRQGVMKIVPNRFTDVLKYYSEELSQIGIDDDKLVVNTTCLYGSKVLLGTDGGLLVLNDSGYLGKLFVEDAHDASGNEYDPIEMTELLNNVRIRSIIRDSKNRLWFSTYSDYGLIRYERGHVMFFRKKDGMPSTRMRAVCEASDGSILVACTGGAVRIVGDEIRTKYNETFGIINTEVLTVAEGMNGDVLIGTDGDGIYIVRTDGNTLHYTVDEGLSSGVVMRIKKDPKRDVFWIVTSNSIAFADANRTIHTVKNFPYSNNFDIYINNKDKAWVLSSNGIYLVDEDELIRNRDINPVFYSRDNGLQHVSTANSYSDISDNGDLYIACSTGVVKVNIDSATENIQVPKAAIPYIEGDGVLYYPLEDGSFRIPASVKKVTVHCHVFNYTLINPDVSFRLEGYEDSFRTMKRDEMGPVDYTNLKGGVYRYQLYMKDLFGHSDFVLDVTIRKTGAFYETIWFNSLALLFLLGFIAYIVYLYVDAKLRKLIERERQQEIFIDEMTEAFARTIDMKDRYTNGHSFRVAKYTTMLAKELGYSDDDIKKYHRIALLHDIGKIGVPGAVLNKQGKLTDEEFAIIKSHAARGHRVLKDISIMPELAIGAAEHHERPDGKGYPKGLKGEEIARVAQIIAVADTFDAMYSDRPYRKRMNFEKAVSIIKEGSGTQLTADVVDAFLRLVDRGEFRAPDDVGGGTTEDINNIHKDQQKAAEAADAKPAETTETKPAETAENAEAKPDEAKPDSPDSSETKEG